MRVLDSILCGNDYTVAASVQDVYNSNGGYFVIQNNDTYMRMQYGTLGNTTWTQEVHVPVGNGILQPGTLGVQFRNYTAGSVATVSVSLSNQTEPALALTAGGQAGTPVVSLINGVTGSVSPTGTVVSGSGWSATNPGAGQYVVTFSPALTAVPIVVATAYNGNSFIVDLPAPATAAGFNAYLYEIVSATLLNKPWGFIAILPQ